MRSRVTQHLPTHIQLLEHSLANLPACLPACLPADLPACLPVSCCCRRRRRRCRRRRRRRCLLLLLFVSDESTPLRPRATHTASSLRQARAPSVI
jgi:hypothetical protein